MCVESDMQLKLFTPIYELLSDATMHVLWVDGNCIVSVVDRGNVYLLVDNVTV